jgi:hypothetical protein
LKARWQKRGDADAVNANPPIAKQNVASAMVAVAFVLDALKRKQARPAAGIC